MDFNLTLLGQITFFWIVIATALSYFLSKNRVSNPVATVLINFILGFFPPISLISLFLLANKKQQPSN